MGAACAAAFASAAQPADAAAATAGAAQWAALAGVAEVTASNASAVAAAAAAGGGNTSALADGAEGRTWVPAASGRRRAAAAAAATAACTPAAPAAPAGPGAPVNLTRVSLSIVPPAAALAAAGLAGGDAAAVATLLNVALAAWAAAPSAAFLAAYANCTGVSGAAVLLGGVRGAVIPPPPPPPPPPPSQVPLIASTTIFGTALGCGIAVLIPLCVAARRRLAAERIAVAAAHAAAREARHGRAVHTARPPPGAAKDADAAPSQLRAAADAAVTCAEELWPAGVDWVLRCIGGGALAPPAPPAPPNLAHAHYVGVHEGDLVNPVYDAPPAQAAARRAATTASPAPTDAAAEAAAALDASDLVLDCDITPRSPLQRTADLRALDLAPPRPADVAVALKSSLAAVLAAAGTTKPKRVAADADDEDPLARAASEALPPVAAPVAAALSPGAATPRVVVTAGSPARSGTVALRFAVPASAARARPPPGAPPLQGLRLRDVRDSGLYNV